MPKLPPPDSADLSVPDHKLSRREFARSAALAATAAIMAPAALLPQETASKPAQSPQNPPQPTAAGLSPELQAEGELKYQWVMEKYGSRLSETEKKDVHRLIMEGQKPLAAFRAFPLDNSDQPATVLKFTDPEALGNPGRAALAQEAAEGSGR
jgi:hypothetical protein